MADANKKLTLGNAVLGILAAVSAAVVAQQLTHAYFRRNDDTSLQRKLNQVASKINLTLPMMIDRETELTNTVGLPRMIVYNYRLVNVSAADISPDELIAALRPQVVSAACSTPETRDTFLKHGVTLRYSYGDKERRYIAAIDVTPANCGY